MVQDEKNSRGSGGHKVALVSATIAALTLPLAFATPSVAIQRAEEAIDTSHISAKGSNHRDAIISFATTPIPTYLKDAIDQYNTDRAKTNEEWQKVNPILNDRSGHESVWTAQYHNAQKRVDLANRELVPFKDAYDAVKPDYIQKNDEFNTLNTEYQKKLASVESEINELKAKIADLPNNNYQGYADVLQDAARINKQVDALKTEYKSVQDSYNELKNVYQDVKTKEDAYKSAYSKLVGTVIDTNHVTVNTINNEVKQYNKQIEDVYGPLKKSYDNTVASRNNAQKVIDDYKKNVNPNFNLTLPDLPAQPAEKTPTVDPVKEFVPPPVPQYIDLPDNIAEPSVPPVVPQVPPMPWVPVVPVPTASAKDLTVTEGTEITNDMIKDQIETTGKIKSVEPVNGPINTKVPGTYKPEIKVTYENGSSVTIPMTVTVNQKWVDIKPIPEAKARDLVVKEGTTITDDMIKAQIDSPAEIKSAVPVKGAIDTSKPGTKTVDVKVTFADGSSRIVPMTVTVNMPWTSVVPVPTASAKDLTVTEGTEITNDMIKDQIETTGKIKSVEPVDGPINTKVPGTYKPEIKVTYENGSSVTIPMTVTVNPKWMDIKPIPEAKARDLVVKEGTTITDDMIKAQIDSPAEIKSAVPVKGAIDTSKPGTQTVDVKVTFADGSSRIVPMTVTVDAPTPDTGNQGQGETANPDQGQGGTVNPDQGQGGNANPDQGQGGNANPDQGQGGTVNPDQGQGGDANPDQGQGGNANPDQGQGGDANPDQGQGGNANPGQGGDANPDQGQGGNANPDQGQGGNANPDQGQGGNANPDQGQGGTVNPDQGQGGNANPDQEQGGDANPGQDGDANPGQGGDANPGQGGNANPDQEQGGTVNPDQGQGGNANPDQGQGGNANPDQGQGGNANPDQGQGGNANPDQGQGGNANPGQGQGGTVNPDQGQGGNANPDQGQGGNANPDQGQGGNANPDQGQGGNANPDQGQGGNANPDQGQGGNANPDQGQGGNANPDQGQGGNANPDQGQGGTVNPDQGQGGNANPDQGQGGNANPDQGQGGTTNPDQGQDGATGDNGHGSGNQGNENQGNQNNNGNGNSSAAGKNESGKDNTSATPSTSDASALSSVGIMAVLGSLLTALGIKPRKNK